jgi:hypothetical protein
MSPEPTYENWQILIGKITAGRGTHALRVVEPAEATPTPRRSIPYKTSE